MKLKQLLSYPNIVIQCHDNPDADAISSGFALYRYLSDRGITARLIYSGKFEIQKSNLVKLVQSLEIPIEYVKELTPPELLITVDCQYGESNVTKFDANEVAVIDHHQVSGSLPKLNEVRSTFGACSTILYEMLKEGGLTSMKTRISQPHCITGFLPIQTGLRNCFDRRTRTFGIPQNIGAL